MERKKALLDTAKLDEAPTMVFRITHRHELISLFIASLVFFGILMALKNLPKQHQFSWNDESRFATIESIVENPPSMPRFAIDYTTYGWWTGDKIFDGKHFYSTKPPVLSAIGAVIYYVLHNWFNLDYSNSKHEGLVYFIITFLLIGVSTSVTIALFYDVMRRMGLVKAHAMLLTISLALGSLFFPYTLIFNNHTFAGACLFIAFYFLFRTSEHRGSRGWNLFFSGLFSGLAVTTDIVGAAPLTLAYFLFIMSMGLTRGWYKPVDWKFWVFGLGGILPFIKRFFLNRRVRRLGVELWGSFLLGFLIFTFIHCYLNVQITGDLKPIYSKQALYSKLAVEGYFGEVISSKDSLVSQARLRYVVNSTFGIRGVFLYTPILLFSFYFMFRAALDKRNRLSRLAFLVLLFLIPSWIYLLFEVKNYGGTSYASRYFIAPMPVMLFFNAYLYRYASNKKLKGWFYEAFRLSVLMAFVGIFFPWGVNSEMFPMTNFSLFNNLQYWTFDFLKVVGEILGNLK